MPMPTSPLISATLCSQSEPFALQVRDDAMIPEFWPGCVITIDPTAPPSDGVYVLVEFAHEFLFRQLKIEGNELQLIALNPAFPALALDSKNDIKGVIMQRAGTRRRDHKRYDISKTRL